jgi:hypothetical protein
MVAYINDISTGHFVQLHKIDVLLLNETHLSDQQNFKTSNFFTYTTNRPTAPGHPPSGGTAILVHRRFSHNPITILTSSLENTTVHIHVCDTELRLSAAYKRP